jgi:transcriptional regulator with GAF, ATPase, and Fis domain
MTQELSTEPRFADLVGASAALRRLFVVLPRIAGSDTTVLLLGETGTGKTMLAQAIHDAGPRASQPFLVVDCASIPPTLIETELLGHDKGAFTGAHTARPGAFEAAGSGTVLLDEIGELPLEMQPKLLNAIEQRVVRRVGTTTPIKLQCRILAATNRELRHEVNRGAFRSDLYYRLNTVTLRMPPLRERREDIPLLARDFMRQFGVEEAEIERYESVVEEWGKRDWPGNVRELRSAVERAVLLGPEVRSFDSRFPQDDEKAPDSNPGAVKDAEDGVPFRSAKERALNGWEREYLKTLLAVHDGNLSRAARAAQMDRGHLRSLARRHGLLEGTEED